MVSPFEVVIAHCEFASSHTAFSTRVSNSMSLRRSKRSATWFAYARISGWGEYFSLQVHSCSSSLEKEYE